MNQFAIIGAGQLGSRHLQSLSTMVGKIWVYDPSEESLAMAKTRLSEVNHKAVVVFSSQFNSAPKEIDLAVVSTNSDVRLSCIKNLVLRSKVKNLILEKVLFNKRNDYYEAKNILENHQVKTWVNCPRRTWDIYKQIKILKSINSPITVSIHGGEFGLGSNSIHFLDLVAFLIPNETIISINLDAIDPEVIESKRKNFKELTGTLSVLFSSGSTMNLHFQKKSQVPICILMTFENLQFSINESHKKITKFENLTCSEYIFEIPHQSQLTHQAAEQILNSDTCELTPFGESINLHLPLIESFSKFMKIEKMEVCPVT